MIYWRFMPEGCRKAEQTACAQQLLAEALKREYQMLILPQIEKTEKIHTKSDFLRFFNRIKQVPCFHCAKQ